MSKYGAQRTLVDGISFDSKAEAGRYGELKLLLNKGLIGELVLQPRFVLAPAVTLDGRTKPALRHQADFSYVDTKTGASVVEDVKGMVTPVYRIKRHLMATVHGIQVKEIR